VTQNRLLAQKGQANRLDVFVYFDNEAEVYAPFDPQRLAAQPGGE
jgi:hypothetical protein